MMLSPELNKQILRGYFLNNVSSFHRCRSTVNKYVLLGLQRQLHDLGGMAGEW